MTFPGECHERSHRQNISSVKLFQVSKDGKQKFTYNVQSMRGHPATKPMSGKKRTHSIIETCWMFQTYYYRCSFAAPAVVASSEVFRDNPSAADFRLR